MELSYEVLEDELDSAAAALNTTLYMIDTIRTDRA